MVAVTMLLELNAFMVMNALEVRMKPDPPNVACCSIEAAHDTISAWNGARSH